MSDARPISELLRGGAHAQLVTMVYDELRALARAKMARETPGHTLQPTALVNEAWMKLFDGGQTVFFESRAHFFGAAAEAMRRILVDRARRVGTEKHGGMLKRQELDESDIAILGDAADLTGISDALDELTAKDPRAVMVVKLRYFAGLSIEETAKILEISPTTVKADWTATKAWLRHKLRVARGEEPEA